MPRQSTHLTNILTGLVLRSDILDHSIVQYSSTVVSTLVADASCRGSIPVNGWRDLIEWTWVWKLMSSASIWCTGCPKTSLTYQIPTWSIDLILRAAPKHVLPSASHGHGGGSGILRQISFSASGKWGCFGIPKTAPIEYAKWRWAGRLSWPSARSLPDQHWPASTTSILLRKWIKQIGFS